MLSRLTFRYPHLHGVLLSLLGFAFCVVLLFCMVPKAEAAPMHHRAHAHVVSHIRHLHPKAPATQPDAAPVQFFDLSPEQQAVLQWVLDSATPKLAPEQARQIVLQVYEQAKAIALDPVEFITIMRVESRFNPRARSSEGAQGLMQVLTRVHKAKLHGKSAYDIETSIAVGAQILGDCLDRFDHNLPKALNCYSGGGGRAYNALFTHFHHEANHYIALNLFNTPEVAPPQVSVESLPQHEEVYQLALR